LAGRGFDRTQEYAARQRGQEVAPSDSATVYTVQLTPLPCWEHLSPEQQRERAAEIVRECDAEAAERRERTGVIPLGPVAIQQQAPHDWPMTTKKSAAPLFHAATKRVRKELYGAYYAFWRPTGQHRQGGGLEISPQCSPSEASRQRRALSAAETKRRPQPKSCRLIRRPLVGDGGDVSSPREEEQDEPVSINRVPCQRRETQLIEEEKPQIGAEEHL
jgi:hypothetical protein